jgi:hypothetical protein
MLDRLDSGKVDGSTPAKDQVVTLSFHVVTQNMRHVAISHI